MSEWIRASTWLTPTGIAFFKINWAKLTLWNLFINMHDVWRKICRISWTKSSSYDTSRYHGFMYSFIILSNSWNENETLVKLYGSDYIFFNYALQMYTNIIIYLPHLRLHQLQLECDSLPMVRNGSDWSNFSSCIFHKESLPVALVAEGMIVCSVTDAHCSG